MGMLDDKRLRELRRRALRTEGRIPAQIRPSELADLVEEVIDSRERMKALKWKPITERNLPQDGDEVGGFGSFPFCLDVVTYAVIKDCETWRNRTMTHFRALDAPEVKS
jgi:hypothetical protein